MICSGKRQNPSGGLCSGRFKELISISPINFLKSSDAVNLPGVVKQKYIFVALMNYLDSHKIIVL